MIYYTLTRMWLFHGEINSESFIWQTDTLEKNGQVILEHPFAFTDNKQAGRMIAKWRSFSKEQAEGHNIFPLIDIVPDEKTLSLLEKYFIGENNNCYLSSCNFRITDYGHLNVYLEFSLENIEELKKIVKQESKITRKIFDLIPNLDPLILELRKQEFINTSDNYYGIPTLLKEHLNLTITDTYLFEEIIILTSSSKKIINDLRKQYAINDEPEKVETFEIHGIDQTPIICSEKELNKEELYDLIEPFNLVLAEKNVYDSSSNLNYSITELMSKVDYYSKNRSRHYKKNKMINAFKSFTQSDLRKANIKTHFLLHCINSRRPYLSTWQVILIRLYKQMNPFNESIDNCESSEFIITKLIEEKSQESQKKRSNILDIFLLFISSLTLYSTYFCIVDFLKSNHNDFGNIDTNSNEMKLLYLITILLMSVLIYMIKMKKKY